jgi:hypothetical protein
VGSGGRPSKYKDEFAETAKRLALLGLTDAEMANVFDVSEQTLNAWKQAHPEFLESLNEGKAIADGRIAERLFHRAMGYSHDAVKIVADAKTKEEHVVHYTEHYPPDTTACIFWLKNRQRGKWRDRIDQEVTGKDGGPIETKELSPNEAARRVAFLLLSQAKEAKE